ncbi:MAG: aspartate/glutamate racemase family protein [Christensenellales bacterium]|jgi:hypothetical protein
MKIAAIYTSATSQLISLIESELRRALPDERPLHIMTRTDPSLLADTIQAGYVQAKTARSLLQMYLEAANAGADILYNVSMCMSDVAYETSNLFGMMGIRLVRIEELMADAALELGSRIGIIATQRIAIDPLKRALQRSAEAGGKPLQTLDIWIEGAFGKTKDETTQMILARAMPRQMEVDVFVLAQESLALCERELDRKFIKPVLSAPHYGAMGVRQAVMAARRMRSIAAGGPGDTQ